MIRMTHTIQHGVSLILCVSVMMILSVMGITFVRLMMFEQVACSNYSLLVDARFAAYAGIERVKAELWHEMLNYGNIDPKYKAHHSNLVDFWYPHAPNTSNDYYKLQTASNNKQYISLTQVNSITNADSTFSYSGSVGNIRNVGDPKLGRFENEGNTYTLKITDPQGKLNLNSHIAAFDGSGNVIAAHQGISNRIMNNIIRSLAEQCGIESSDIIAIADDLRPLDNSYPRFYNSMEDVRRRIRERCTHTVDYDASTGKYPKRMLADNLTVSSWCDTQARTFNKSNERVLRAPINSYGSYRLETRAPINVNTASIELLTALIQNIQASVLIYNSNMDIQNEGTDYGKSTSNPTTTALAYENVFKLDLWRFQISFTKAQAKGIATSIYNRVHTTGPFETWAEFEETFLCNTSNLPNTNLPAIPTSANAEAVISKSGSADLTWINSEPYSTQWYQACRNALRANFNPNALSNFWNPDECIYREVTKADLFSVDGSYNAILSYTTELCFSCLGNADVISLGRISKNNREAIVSSAIMQTNIHVADIFTHTSQEDFTKSTVVGYPKFWDVDSTPVNETTISYPEMYYDRATYSNWNTNVDSHIGWIQPKIQIAANLKGQDSYYLLQSPDYYRNNKNPPATISKLRMVLDPTDPDDLVMGNYAKAPTSPKFVTVPDGTNPASCNVLPDGILSSNRLYVSNDGSYTHKYRYFTENTIVYGGGIGTIKGRGKSEHNLYKHGNANGLSKLGNYKGNMEFWIKLEVPGNSKIMCGLLAWTQVSDAKNTVKTWRDPVTKELKFENVKFREGTQTYLFKTGQSTLRLTRMYFGGFFDSEGKYFGAWNHADGEYNRKAYPKRDILIDISDWRAHTWHHVLIGWDDSTTVLKNSLYIVLDGNNTTPTTTHYYYLGETEMSEFCVLNEKILLTTAELATRHDMDGICLNGFFRNQYQKERSALTFHYDTNIENIGNGTMDGFKSYEDAYEKTDTLSPTRYISNSHYRNIIQLGSSGYLGPLFYTAYPISGPTVTCSAQIRSNSNPLGTPLDPPPPFFTSHATSDAISAYGGGTLPMIKSKLCSVHNGDELEYRLHFSSSARSCAAVDSVSVYVMRLQTGFSETGYSED